MQGEYRVRSRPGIVLLLSRRSMAERHTRSYCFAQRKVVAAYSGRFEIGSTTRGVRARRISVQRPLKASCEE